MTSASGQSSLPRESALLSDSWVVPDLDTFDNQQTLSPQPPAKQNGSRSPPQSNVCIGRSSKNTKMLESSIISGPELIMPSICDSEASWAASNKLSQSSSSTLSRSESEALPERIRKRTPKPGSTEIPINDSDVLRRQANSHFCPAESLSRLWGSRFKITFAIVIILLLLAPILGIISQLPTLPGRLLPAGADQYPDGASPGTAIQGLHTSLERRQHILKSRSQLENTLQRAVQELAAVRSVLRHDHLFHALYNDLPTTTHSNKNELHLEFEGARAARLDVVNELFALQVEIQSTVDNLLRQEERPQSNRAAPTVEHKVVRKRWGGCLSWLPFRTPIQSLQPLVSEALPHEKLLDMVGSLFVPRLNSILRSLAAFDDHLQSAQKIISRAEKGEGIPSPLQFIRSFFEARVLPAFQFSIQTPIQSQINPAQEPISDMVRVIASHNQTLTAVVLQLTILETLQRE